MDRAKWYIADPEGDEPKGPFSTADVQAQLKKNAIKMEEFIWCDEYAEGDWKRVFEVSEFKSNLTPKLKLATPKKKSSAASLARPQIKIGRKNIYRRFPRVDLHAKVIIHDDQQYLKTDSIDISEQGIFVRVPHLEIFSKGQELSITVIDAPIIGTFSVRGVILRIMEREDRKGYGLIFMRLNPNIRAKIAQYVLAKLEEKPDLKQREAG